MYLSIRFQVIALLIPGKGRRKAVSQILHSVFLYHRQHVLTAVFVLPSPSRPCLFLDEHFTPLAHSFRDLHLFHGLGARGYNRSLSYWLQSGQGRMEWREEWEKGWTSKDEYSATSLGKVCRGPAGSLMNSPLGFAAWRGSMKQPCFFTDCPANVQAR